MGLGSEIRDQVSGKTYSGSRKVKKAPDPRSATLVGTEGMYGPP
jgi:hypothetical protein